MDKKQLLQLWTETKHAEDEANRRRIELESILGGLVESKPDGSKTTHVDGYKVTVTRRTNYRLDMAVWDSVKNDIPAAQQPVKIKTEIDGKKYRELADRDPLVWNKVAEAVTAREGKPTFKIIKEEG
jgi:hypothetical protein